ncbi:MAG: hypothetical protein NTX86_00325 [Candidatus Dependentiae bacterium]|nr:hypothetical protein [Candidatus Dependentiae bacterium]
MDEKYSLEKFVPLIKMYAAVIVLTIAKQFLFVGHDHLVTHTHDWMNDFMGIMFLMAGTFKVMDLCCFADAFEKYDLVARLCRPYALGYPFIELGLGVAYMFRWQLLLVNWTVLALMLVSSAGVAHALWNKVDAKCGCMGIMAEMPVTFVTLLEDLLMAAMAVMMLYM